MFPSPTTSGPPFMGPPPSLPPRRRRPGCGCGCLARLVAQLFVFAVIVSGMTVGFDYLNAPWAYDWFGNPSLTGDWSGTVTAPDKRHGTLHLTLTHPLPRIGRHRSAHVPLREIQGTADLDFSPNGPKQSYTVQGEMDSDGHTAKLQLQNPHPTQGGNYLSELKGKWTGSTLALTGHWTPVMIDSQRGPVWHHGPSPQQATVTLHKSSNTAR